MLGKSSSHMTIPLRQGSSRRVFVSGVSVSLCAEPRRGQLVLVIRRVWELPISGRHGPTRLRGVRCKTLRVRARVLRGLRAAPCVLLLLLATGSVNEQLEPLLMFVPL